MNYNICGKILKTHGLKGEVKVLNSSDFNRFAKGKIVYYLEDDNYIELKIKEVKDANPLIVSFVGLDDINLVEKLVGKDIYAKREKDDLAANEYYYSDLIGKPVFNQAGQKRANVIDVIELPQGHYLVCEVTGKRKLVPFNEHFVKDVLTDKIIIEEIEGLLWQ